jgi:hypothetical protein
MSATPPPTSWKIAPPSCDTALASTRFSGPAAVGIAAALVASTTRVEVSVSRNAT